MDNRQYMTLGAAFGDTIARRRSATALVYDGTQYSFTEIGARAAAVAGGLLQRGVRRGDRVAVGLRNSPELVVSVLGVLQAGAVLVPLNPAYTADEVTYVVRDAGASLAIVESEHAMLLAQAQLPQLSVIATALDGFAAACPAGVCSRSRGTGAHCVHLGHHRPAEGRHPLAPRVAE